MSQIEAEIIRLKNEARKTLATVLAEQAISMEANISKAQRNIDRDKELLEEIRSIDVNDKDALNKYFGHGFGSPMYKSGDQVVDIRQLLDIL